MTWLDISLILTLSPKATLFILHKAFLWKLDLVRARGFMIRTEYKRPDPNKGQRKRYKETKLKSGYYLFPI